MMTDHGARSVTWLPRSLARLAKSLRAHAGRIGTARKMRVREVRTTGAGHVVSFSLYGTDPRYVRGGLLNIEAYRRHFPEYACRFYVAEDVPWRTIDELHDAGAEIAVMGAGGIDATYMFWRFLASEDLSKRRFLIRDIDSAASARERALHDRWIASGMTWWILRDHYSHSMRMMGGMWGGHTSPSFISPLLRRLWRYGNHYNRDQKFLSDVVYPRIRHSAKIQDIVRRFPDEDLVPHEVDADDFSFVGEIATDLQLRKRWREEFRRMHEARPVGLDAEPVMTGNGDHGSS
jgi:hypothetical protein